MTTDGDIRSAAALVHIFREIASTAMPPAGKFPCPICSTAKFDSPKDLGIHILKDHSGAQDDEADEKPDPSQLDPPPSQNDKPSNGKSPPPMVSTISTKPVTVTDKIIEMRVDALADAIDDMIEENKPQDEK